MSTVLEKPLPAWLAQTEAGQEAIEEMKAVGLKNRRELRSQLDAVLHRQATELPPLRDAADEAEQVAVAACEKAGQVGGQSTPSGAMLAVLVSGTADQALYQARAKHDALESRIAWDIENHRQALEAAPAQFCVQLGVSE